VAWAALAVAGAVFAGVARYRPEALPWVTVALFALIGVTMTRPAYLALDALGVGTAVMLVLTLTGQPAWSSQTLGLVLLGTIVLGFALYRDRDEVIAAIGGSAAADALLIDLRERIWRHRPPVDLPAQWLLETDLRAARGDGFCGDFVVTASDPGRHLDVALVDVSGKGSAAGARAVLLSGALEALLNAVSPSQFLPAANAHVLRTGDDDGFATAVHASIDLVSGAFTIAGAGHPPAVHYRAGAGRWDLLDEEQGPVLGLMPGPAYPARTGVLARGDVLLLYTDGLVENRLLDVTRGIDRLVGHAEALLARHGEGLAPAITEAIRAQDGDDRALVVIRRL
jgi:Stage II sporulation protein E (SpoIIE)